MENNDIDNLIQIVSPDLIANYERINGVKLAETNDEYKKVCNKDSELVGRIFPSVFSSVNLIFALIIFVWTKNSFFAFAVFVIMTAVYFYFRYVVLKNLLKIKETIARCTNILDSFKTAVEKMDPIAGGNNIEYTESYIHHGLVWCAMRILEAEKDFDSVRLQEKRRISDILLHGDRLERYGNEFSTALKAAERFGLNFNRGDLFAKALKRFESLNK